MSTDASQVADPEVEQVEWDLEPLVYGEGEAGVDRLLDEARERADAFAAAHAGKVAEIDGAGLRDAMTELLGLEELVARAGNYAALRFAVDTADPERGALLQRVQERAIMSLADLVESPAGLLWSAEEGRGFVPSARWNMPAIDAVDCADAPDGPSTPSSVTITQAERNIDCPPRTSGRMPVPPKAVFQTCK